MGDFKSAAIAALTMLCVATPAAGQVGATIPAWAIGTYDCRVNGTLATMTWRLDPKEVITVVPGGTRTDRTYYPVGMVQYRGAADFEDLEAASGTDETRLTFAYHGAWQSLVQRADRSLQGQSWNCAPPGQQVPRLRSELELQQGTIRRPSSSDPSNLRRRN